MSRSETIRDAYGEYTPSSPEPVVPPFPCVVNPACTAEKTLCHCHSNVLFVRLMAVGGREYDGPSVIKIPYGRWENWEWYADRISDATGLEPGSFRMIFAGCERRPGEGRHSGLERGSTFHCLLK